MRKINEFVGICGAAQKDTHFEFHVVTNVGASSSARIIIVSPRKKNGVEIVFIRTYVILSLSHPHPVRSQSAVMVYSEYILVDQAVFGPPAPGQFTNSNDIAIPSRRHHRQSHRTIFWSCPSHPPMNFWMRPKMPFAWGNEYKTSERASQTAEHSIKY